MNFLWNENIDNILDLFYKECYEKGLCVHECQYFDERKYGNYVWVKSWSRQTASINVVTKKVKFIDFKTWKHNFHIDNNRGCLQCNNSYNYYKVIANEFFNQCLEQAEEINGTAK